MGKLIVLAPYEVAGLTADRGSGVANLLTVDPREVWADAASGGVATFRIDLGAVREVDTIFLGHAIPLPAATAWTIRGGAASYTAGLLMARSAMRVVDGAGRAPERSHGLWTGTPAMVRFLQIEIEQPSGAQPLAIGTLLVGKAFEAEFNQEWGGGRGVIDTGRASRLPGGGFAIVHGMRKGSYSWSLGDLSVDETDALYDIQLQCGETQPLLVVEDPDRTVGQFYRIHYAKFANLKAYKRRNQAQTRWEFEVEQWG